VTIGVAVDDLDQSVAAATAKGGGGEMPPTDNGWVVKAQVRDPGRQSRHADRALNDARPNELLRALAHEERRRILFGAPPTGSPTDPLVLSGGFV
jgi:hypothetical protein